MPVCVGIYLKNVNAEQKLQSVLLEKLYLGTFFHKIWGCHGSWTPMKRLPWCCCCHGSLQWLNTILNKITSETNGPSAALKAIIGIVIAGYKIFIFLWPTKYTRFLYREWNCFVLKFLGNQELTRFVSQTQILCSNVSSFLHCLHNCILF